MQLSLLRNPRGWQIGLACYWLTLIVLTHIPVKGSAAAVTTWDKVAHLVAFAILAVILATTWQLSAGHLSVPQLGWTWLVLIVFAGLDEWTQTFVGRQADLWDWVSDAAGAAIGLAAFFWLRRAMQRESPRDRGGAV